MIFLDKTKGLNRIEKVINSALRTDPTTFEKLKKLGGESVVIESMSPSFTVNILVTDNGIQLTRETFDYPSVRISGSLTSIIKTLTKKNAKSAIRETDIKINGDFDTLKKISDIAQSLEIDWEGILGNLIGKIPARILYKTLGEIIRINNETQQRLTKNIVNSLRDEFDITPTHEEFLEFSSKVRNISTTVDRLEAKLKKLEANLDKPLNQGEK